jgi:hypothetical protein
MAMSRTNPRMRLTEVARLTTLAAEAICRMCRTWVVMAAFRRQTFSDQQSAISGPQELRLNAEG